MRWIYSWLILFGTIAAAIPLRLDSKEKSFRDVLKTSPASKEAVYQDRCKKVHSLKFSYRFFGRPNLADTDYSSLRICIHGIDRKTDNCFSWYTTESGKEAFKNSKTLFVAPVFRYGQMHPKAPGKKDMHEGTDQESISCKDLEEISWKEKGSFNRNELDMTQKHKVLNVYKGFVEFLLKTYKNVVDVKMFGFSAGGQFTNRFIASHHMDEIKNSHPNIKFSFLVGDPSSYLYLDNKRADAEQVKVCKDKNCQITKFAVPANTCKGHYDNYKYGIKFSNPQDDDIFKADSSTVVKRYNSYHVDYFFGLEDNHVGKVMDKSCEAMLQGSNRFVRGLIFYQYMQKVHSNKNQDMHIIQASHNSWAIYTSPEAIKVFFPNQNSNSIKQLK